MKKMRKGAELFMMVSQPVWSFAGIATGLELAGNSVVLTVASGPAGNAAAVVLEPSSTVGLVGQSTAAGRVGVRA